MTEHHRGRAAAPDLPPALVRFGWDRGLAEDFAAHAPPGSLPGRVARSDRGGAVVLLDGGPVSARSTRAPVVAGDWVAVDVASDPPEVTALLERRSALRRRDPGGATADQVLAANVDLVLVVHGLDRPIVPGRLDRSLVLAWESGAVPAVVLTKADLVAEPAEALDEVGAVAPGVDVVATSATTGLGLEEVSRWLAPHRTAVLLGASGVGKSSLVNRLVGTDLQAVRSVRAADGKGRHTTTTRDLVPLPGGGVLLDTPGLRALGLWGEGEGLSRTFADVEDLAGSCRFRDCRHAGEPGCAVQAAVDDGRLDPGRLERFRRLERELTHLELRLDEQARRARDRRVARLYREIKRERRHRPRS